MVLIFSGNRQDASNHFGGGAAGAPAGSMSAWRTVGVHVDVPLGRAFITTCCTETVFPGNSGSEIKWVLVSNAFPSFVR
jgi:hypothetical protein